MYSLWRWGGACVISATDDLGWLLFLVNLGRIREVERLIIRIGWKLAQVALDWASIIACIFLKVKLPRPPWLGG